MTGQPLRAETIRLVVLGLLVVALGSAVILVLAPFVVSMLWAGILAFATWPLYARLVTWTGGRDWICALCMTLLMAALVVLPTLWLLYLLRADVSVLADLERGDAVDGDRGPVEQAGLLFDDHDRRHLVGRLGDLREQVE